MKLDLASHYKDQHSHILYDYSKRKPHFTRKIGPVFRHTLSLSLYICLYIYMYIYIYADTMSIYKCIYVYTYIHIYIYTDIFAFILIVGQAGLLPTINLVNPSLRKLPPCCEEPRPGGVGRPPGCVVAAPRRTFRAVLAKGGFR